MSEEIETKVKKTFDYLCSKLDFTKENGLVEEVHDTKEEHQRYILKRAKEKLGIDAIFFLKPSGTDPNVPLPNVPLIYFRKLESRDTQKIAELHKSMWNMGQAPLLFVVLPQTVLIYSAYECPRKVEGELDDKAGLIDTLKLFVETDNEVQKIMRYHRSNIVTEDFWRRYSEKFKKENRVYRTLLKNLDFMREKLIKADLSPEIIHNLLIRCIFIKYLEDRKDKNGHNVFPEGFFEKFLEGAKSFIDVLSNKKATYNLFRDLDENKFNGDIFTFEENEESKVDEKKHLPILQDLLSGEKYLESGQMMLWPLYSFDMIPIELISNIYQKFIHSEGRSGRSEGIYYTPYHLVTFLMDEVLPWDGTNFDIKILDPSCGSGVFLVEAYRRLIARWEQAHSDRSPSYSILIKILKENIFGVDKSYKAIKIAALSLYLTLCDYLEPQDIWNEVAKKRFEPIIGKNLFESDFFKNKSFSIKKYYDIIVGNPPWKSELTAPAKEYIEENNKPVGDKQISQAFLWKAAELCKEEGSIFMIVSSKGLLFNRSDPNRKFRKKFFSTFNIETIINLSALRHHLFSDAVGPGAAIRFSPNDPDDRPIFYCSPKPGYSPQDDWLLLIEPQNIAHIPKEKAVEDDLIWKVAMWGSPRDYELIKRLSKLPSLKDICEKKNWKPAEGFIVGNRKDGVPELHGKPYVDVKKLDRFKIDEESLPPLKETHFYRHAKKNRKIFKGPHLLIKQSPKTGTGLIAAVLKGDAVFRHSILGFHVGKSDLNLLAACCLFINTKIALYYQMLTSRSWLVERSAFEKKEIMNIPLPKNIFDLDITYDFLDDLSKNPNSDEIVNKAAMEFFDLTEFEMALIDDAIEVTLDYFRRKNKSIALKPTNREILENYVETFCSVLDNSFSSIEKSFVGTIFMGESPLQVVSIRLIENAKEKGIKRINQSDELRDILEELEKALIQERSPSIYIRRNLRKYSGDTVYIIKPDQTRYWTKSAALRDADETYADIMSLWGSL